MILSVKQNANSIGDWADNNYLIERKYYKGQGNILKLSNQKTRNSEKVEDMELIMDNNLVLHRLQQNSSGKAISKHNIVVQALNELGGRVTKQKDLTEKVAEISDKSAATSRTMITAAVDEGYIIAGDDKGNNKNKIFRISETEK